MQFSDVVGNCMIPRPLADSASTVASWIPANETYALEKNGLSLSGTVFSNADSNVKRIYEGSPDAKIVILAFESLTCSHCANFHKDIYPELKQNFIDKGFVKLEFRNFPLDLAAFNAAKVAQCKVNKGEEILHFLYSYWHFLSIYWTLGTVG